ncbi:hypothetical protein [Polycladidibacter hongkongensis]|uniref:hypothetical protein n=1 Tax=Polycladidibacter hongkongensis TaxID=1647556 RepID=UPI000831A089|nr:hypothetical protein [Pseudovibrio hongkongensis]
MAVSKRQLDFLLLNIYIWTQHRKYDEALTLVEGLRALEVASKDLVLAHATVLFLQENYEAALSHLQELDSIDPQERFGDYVRSNEQTMRHFMRARCLYSLQDEEHARRAIDIYLGSRRAKLARA